MVKGAGGTQLVQARPARAAASRLIVEGRRIGPLKTVALKMNGRYTDSNLPPMAFSLNGATCDTFVSKGPDEPSRFVETLPDGTLRLGPTKSPIPGVSVGDGGLITVTPTTKPAPGNPGQPGTTTSPAAPGETTTPPIVETTKPAPEESETLEPTPEAPTTRPPVETTPPPATDPVVDPPTTTDKPTIPVGGDDCDEVSPGVCA